MRLPERVLLDLDGTLVDSNYHHALAWFRAFRDLGVVVPIWTIHRHVGMGGDILVPTLTDDRFESEHGDEARDLHGKHFRATIEEIEPLPAAREFLRWLDGRGHTVVLATSSHEEDLEHFLDLLDAREVVDGWTMAEDVDATKPHPELVEVAREKAGPGDAVLVGDSRFDCEAAKRAGIVSIGLLTGGFAEQELLDAGASEVFESLPDLMRACG